MQAHERAVERGCEAMQVFNQSPRMWRPTRWKPDDVAQFLELRKSGPIDRWWSAKENTYDSSGSTRHQARPS